MTKAERIVTMHADIALARETKALELRHQRAIETLQQIGVGERGGRPIGRPEMRQLAKQALRDVGVAPRGLPA